MKLSDIFGGHPLTLFPRVRKEDPVTSYEAADSIKNKVPDHYTEIIECLILHGALGKDGISNKTRLDPNQVARRLSEMSTLGFIELTGETVKSNSNRKEREWRLKEKE